MPGGRAGWGALVLACCVLTSAAWIGARAAAPVRAWTEATAIPTYVAGAPEPNPMFYFGRASQGAEGRVYPYPLYDTLTHRKEDRTYQLVYLENEYLKVGILPEIGGRIFSGVDKSNGYDFFYRQHVIKPALIGLIGAWISGGVEWNIPHHHRATTFIPVQHTVVGHADGGQTVWVGELELRHRMRWAVGYTLRPGSSVLEVSVRIANRTPVANTMLCFANVAVHATEEYQVIFPPRTQYVTHHHKREFTTWPIATTRYGGYDFSAGVDVSWYRNHVAANSMFAWNYEDDFLAGYDHGRQAGLLSVADHHIVPGKKLWTWGNGPRGRMWDHILTDTDGPYLELMVGAYSDNQPDYSWLGPGEVRTFELAWYPFRGIGGVKQANLDAAVNLEVGTNGTALVGFHTTAPQRDAVVRFAAGDRVLLEERVTLDPARPYVKQVPLPAGVEERSLRASLSAGGRELVAYAPVGRTSEPTPVPVQPPPSPDRIQSLEELYLTGLRIEQFHHPSLDPEPYWEEALRRDPGDTRVNTALGVSLLKRARWADAERHFRKALERLTAGYTSPKDAEPFYYLGVALKAQGRIDEAFTELYRAVWSAAWRGPAYLALAQIATGRGDFPAALDLVTRSLEANALDVRALTLKAAALRHLGRTSEGRPALEFAAERVDPLDVRVAVERWLASGLSEDATRCVAVMTAHPATALETAAEFWEAGLWSDGTRVLQHLVEATADPARLSPMVFYYLGAFAERQGLAGEAAAHRRRAREQSPAYVFPFQAEAIAVLRAALAAEDADARASYYLGNLLFDWQPDEAVTWWERSAALDPSFPIVHRNLAIAYSHRPKGNALDQAIASLERAVALPEKYPLHFFELDELYAAAAVAPAKRLAVLEAQAELVARRDDALGRLIGLKVFAGRYDEAIQLMTGRRFAVWEGGSLSVADAWIDAHLLRGHAHRQVGRPDQVLAEYAVAKRLPDNLPTERGGSAERAAELAWWTGLAHAAAGRPEDARSVWTEATRSGGGGRGGDAGSLSERSVQGYYRALALRKLGQDGEAETVLRGLVKSAEDALGQGAAQIDFFASFGAQQSQRTRLALAHFVGGLGHLGLGEAEAARAAFTRALELSPDHLGAHLALTWK